MTLVITTSRWKNEQGFIYEDSILEIEHDAEFFDIKDIAWEHEDIPEDEDILIKVKYYADEEQTELIRTDEIWQSEL